MGAIACRHVQKNRHSSARQFSRQIRHPDLEDCYQKINIRSMAVQLDEDAVNFGRPSDKAYVAVLNASNQVSRFRAPLDSSAAAATNPSSVLQWQRQLFVFRPQVADLVALCNVRVESNRVLYMVSEVWKRAEISTIIFQGAARGTGPDERKTRAVHGVCQPRLGVVQGQKPGTTNFFGDSPCQSMSIAKTAWWKSHLRRRNSTISLDQLRRQITD